MSVRTLPVVAPPCPPWCTEAQHVLVHWGGGTYGVLHWYDCGGAEVAQHVLFTADGIVDVEQPGVSWERLEYVDPATARMHAAQLLTAARIATVAGMTVSDAGPRVDDRVQIEARGRIRDLEDRDGVSGALVELDDGGAVWMPRDALVLLRRQD